MKIDDLPGLDWDKGDGLLPAVIQDAGTGRVLMLGYMNRQALRTTLGSGRVTFFSRSRNELWSQAGGSGHDLEALAVSADCDQDTILVQALPAGPVCHTGKPTCFPDAVPTEAESLAFLLRLERVIARRIAEQPEGSYTARLYSQGPGRLAQKIGQEAIELALAAVGEDDSAVLAESADLVYHLTLLLKQRGLSLGAVIEELELRHSGRPSPPPDD